MLLELSLCALLVSSFARIQDKVECPSEGTVFAVHGCNSTYHRCVNGIDYEQQCNSGLAFDVVSLSCEHKHNVNACIERTNDLEYGSNDAPSCAEEADGTLLPTKQPCSNHYVICAHKKAELKTCPYQQFYNHKNKACDYKQNVEACLKTKEGKSKIRGMRYRVNGAYGGDSSATVPQAQDPASPAYQPADKTTQEEKKEEVVLSSYKKAVPAMDKPAQFDCSTKKDGHYIEEGQKCVNFFWNCANGRTYRYDCPKGLWYDIELGKCDYKDVIPNCGGTRPAPTTPAPLRDVPKINFDCTGKPEGSAHVLSECPNEFVNCIGGAPQLLACPKGLVFDIRINACDYIESCRAPLPQPKVDLAHGQPQAYPPASATEPTFDCSGKTDGLYPMQKCFRQYAVCNGGVSTIRTCSSDLVFNEINGSCDYKNVCLAPPAPALPAQAAPASQYGNQQQASMPAAAVPVQPLADTPAQPENKMPSAYGNQGPAPLPAQPIAAAPPAAVDCSKLPNGQHATGSCTENYVNCWNGHGVQTSCPATLVFNPTNGQCDYPSNVQDCPQFKPVVAQSPVAKPQPRPAPVEPFCERLADGTYSSGCQNFYYVCQNQVTSKLFCPVGLFFDIATTSCQMKDAIAACGGRPATSIPPTAQSPPSIESAYGRAQPPKANDQPQQTVNPCAGKTDGIYALPGCTNSYLQCYAGIASTSKCQSTLMYNEANGMCDYKQNVPACGGSLPVPKAADVPKPLPPVIKWLRRGRRDLTLRQRAVAPYLVTALIIVPYVTSCAALSMMLFMRSFCSFQPPNPGPQPYDYRATPLHYFDCSSRSDGYYAEGCGQTYYSCLNRIASKHSCPAGLKFSKQSRQCNFEQYIPECGGQIEQQRPEQPQIPAQSPSEAVFSCLGRADGIYPSDACTSKYISCYAGNTMPGMCKGGLIFNEGNGACDYKQNVPACRPTIAQAPAEQQNQVPYGNEVTLQQAESPCSNLMVRGYVAFGRCSSEYAYCDQGRVSIRTACPAGLVFSNQQQQCIYRSTNPECVPIQQPVQPAPQPAPQQQQPMPQNQDPCTGRTNIALSLGCDQKYIVCMNGRSTTFSCPTGLVYDDTTSRCVFPQMIASCGATPIANPY